MSTARFLWRLILFRPWLYVLNIFLWTAIYTWPIVPGFILQATFDAFDPEAGRFTAWWLIALLVAAAVAKVSIHLAGMVAWLYHRFSLQALLRRNLLAAIMEQPGARALPEPPGDVISRFRDDAEESLNCIDWALDNIGALVFSVVAALVLMRIDAQITILVYLPLVAVVVVVRLASSRLEEYRVDAREATGKVSALLAEMFGAVQAVQTAGAERAVQARFQELSNYRRR